MNENRVIERVLTITLIEHVRTTYRIPVSLNFDGIDDNLVLGDLLANADEDELEVIELSVTHREINVERDETL